MEATYILFPRQGEVSVQTETLGADDLGPHEALLRTEASIISAGTELATLHNTQGDVAFPLRPGYGCIGRIVAKGEALGDFQVGQRVFYAGRHASLQRFTHNQGHQWGTLYRAPDELDAGVAAFACMAQIAFVAPMVARPEAGDTVCVFGLGLVGNLCAQLYKIAGARVLGFDPLPSRCEVAREVGLQAFDVAPNQQIEAVRELTNGRGAQICVDATGHSGVIMNCIQATARFGEVVLLGTPRASFSADITPALFRLHNEGITLRGAHMWRLSPMQRPESRDSVERALEKVFAFLRSGALQVRPLHGHAVAVLDAPQVYGDLQARPQDFLGVTFDWNCS